MNLVVFGALLGSLAAGLLPIAAAGTGFLGIMIVRGLTTALLLQLSGLYEAGLYGREYLNWLSKAGAQVPSERTGKARSPVGEIRLEHVSFQYPNADRPALHDVSMVLRRGESIALVGENGSGKTTLAKILADLYQPDTGRATWDGVSLAEHDPRSVWRQVGLIPQAFTQWPLTAELNIALGDLERYDRAGPDGVIDTARATGAHKIINELRDGYDTVLGLEFDGADLSGGQWQRIAITRAMYRDPPVVVADEPSASLDARAESELFELLQTMHEDRILLLITHRLANVRLADRIYVLKDGEITQTGTHDELMRAGGLYAELYTLQAQSFGADMADRTNGRRS
jgi:ATP-binding cassette subfamily B protein